jgi:tetratricopeptide (TPR) repeat protein
MTKTNKGINLNSPQLFDFAMEILILIVIFVMPTIFDRRLGIVFSGTKVAWMRFFGVAVLGVWAIKLIVTKKHRFIRTALDWPVLSFLLCTTIATLTSVHVYVSLVGFYGRYEGLTSWFIFGLFFFVVTNYIKNFDQLKRIVVTITSAATLMAVYSVIQRLGIDPYMWGGVDTNVRVIGMIGQPNFLAAYMLMAFFLGLVLLFLKKNGAPSEINWSEQLIPIGYFVFAQAAFVVMIYSLQAQNVLLWYFGFSIITASALLFTYTYERLHPWIFDLILGASLVLNYISLLYTQSRGGYMGFFTGASLFVIIAGRHWIFANWKKLAVLSFLIVLVSGITMSQPLFSPFRRFASDIKTTRVESEEPGGKEVRKLELGGAAGARGETWKSGYKIIADYPFFGIGPEVLKMIFPRYETELFRFKEEFHVKQDRAHNETFDVGVTKGLITFLVFLWLLFIVFRVGWRKSLKTEKPEERLMLAGLLAAVLSFLIQNQFSFGVVAITSLFWMIWGMIMVIGEEREAEEAAASAKKISWLEVPWLMIAAVAVIVMFLIYISFFSFRGDILYKVGKVNVGMRRFPQAVEALEKSLKVFPYEGSTVSHLGISYLNLSQGKPENAKYLGDAIAILQYGTQIDPYNADNFYMLSKIHLMLFQTGNPEALGQAQNYAEIALKIDPYYAEVYHILGAIYENQKKYDEAAEQYKKSFFINPNLNPPMQALKNLNRRRGKPAETLKVFDEALEKYETNPVILENTARLYLEFGRVEKALAVSRKMVDTWPHKSSGYVLRGEIYLRKGLLAKAFSDFQQVVVMDPKNVIAHNGLGRIYLLKGDRQRARREFEQTLMLDARNAYAKQMLEKLR